MEGDGMTEQDWLALAARALLALIPGLIAYRKGYSFWMWWSLGLVELHMALLITVFRRRSLSRLELRKIASGSYKRCPFCAEMIKQSALVCRYCGRTIVGLSTEGTEGERASSG